MVGVDQRLRVGARERLDPQRAGEADERPLRPVALHERGALLGGFGGEVEHERPLPREIQHREALLVAHERQLAPARERVDERLCPEVLMNVDAHMSVVGLPDEPERCRARLI